MTCSCHFSFVWLQCTLESVHKRSQGKGERLELCFHPALSSGLGQGDTNCLRLGWKVCEVFYSSILPTNTQSHPLLTYLLIFVREMVFDSYPKAVNFLIFPLKCVRLGFYSSREMEEKVPPHLCGCTGLLSDPTANPASPPPPSSSPLSSACYEPPPSLSGIFQLVP